MLFASTFPALRHGVYAPSGRALERFMRDAAQPSRQPLAHYQQDETRFQLSLDMPGLSREQVSVQIDGPVVRIESRDGAPRPYRAAYEFPQDVDAAGSTARLENGVLTLNLLKKVAVGSGVELAIQ